MPFYWKNFKLNSHRVNLNFKFLFSGKYSKSLHEAHLIIPRRVNSEGALITHHLSHHHQHDHYREGPGDPSDHSIHYHIDLHNETLHLELE